MKILVLGAGYVGSAFTSHFQGEEPQKYEIIPTTTSPEKLAELKKLSPNATLLHASQSDELAKILHECDAIAIFVAPKANATYNETYKNTALAVEEALKGRARPFYILYTSSTGVYDSLKEIHASEDAYLPAAKGNAKILLETEEIYQRCQNEFVKTCILRLGGIYGPGRNLHDRARRFSGKEVAVNGEAFTNHIHLDDIVRAVTFCIESRLTGIYNLVNDAHPARKELYNALCDELQLPYPIWKPDIVIPGERGYRVDNTKIKQNGFVFIHPNITYHIEVK